MFTRNTTTVLAFSLGLPLLLCLLTQFTFAPLTAEEPTTVWKLTRVAAVEDKFVYAIASEKVANYDRKTDERVAVSMGEAKHLTSGFLLEGKLDLAHSNDPPFRQCQPARRGT